MNINELAREFKELKDSLANVVDIRRSDNRVWIVRLSDGESFETYVYSSFEFNGTGFSIEEGNLPEKILYMVVPEPRDADLDYLGDVLTDAHKWICS